MARLYADEPQAALEVLRQAEQSPREDVRADVAWYTLVGIARLRDPSQAETDARAQCARDPRGAARQCRAVEALDAAGAGR
ncbi:MAG: hypothetical protein R2712_30635 [Vicinamibacterales bacterium]